MDDFDMNVNESVPRTPSRSGHSSYTSIADSSGSREKLKSSRRKIQDFPNCGSILAYMNGPVWKTYMTCPLKILEEGIPAIQHPGGDPLDLNIIPSDLDPLIESNTHDNPGDTTNQMGFASPAAAELSYESAFG
jgi:hypothetical protein